MMERYVRPGAAVLDVGAGSGILTAAAQLLGAGRAIACDIDVEAASITRERLGGNVFAGSGDAVRAAAFDVIVANISLPVIERLLPELRRAAAREAWLILSGFREEGQFEGVVDTKERDGWRCAVVHRAPAER